MTRQKIVQFDNGGIVAFQEYGAVDGVPVIFCHGWPSSCTMARLADEPAGGAVCVCNRSGHAGARACNSDRGRGNSICRTKGLPRTTAALPLDAGILSESAATVTAAISSGTTVSIVSDATPASPVISKDAAFATMRCGELARRRSVRSDFRKPTARL